MNRANTPQNRRRQKSTDPGEMRYVLDSIVTRTIQDEESNRFDPSFFSRSTLGMLHRWDFNLWAMYWLYQQPHAPPPPKSPAKSKDLQQAFYHLRQKCAPDEQTILNIAQGKILSWGGFWSELESLARDEQNQILAFHSYFSYVCTDNERLRQIEAGERGLTKKDEAQRWRARHRIFRLHKRLIELPDY
ncbi:hypothetical protein TWF788_003240 [Orbilia oligospora]|uniref:Uncharacterized protein n=1 Tax=Orbilia oligospora TaxID=2813651 RepID=A0A7C8Q0C6_ORBOL|nr:hypothetical protein TWF788_003240 [Orbilia oligospora]